MAKNKSWQLPDIVCFRYGSWFGCKGGLEAVPGLIFRQELVDYIVAYCPVWIGKQRGSFAVHDFADIFTRPDKLNLGIGETSHLAEITFDLILLGNLVQLGMHMVPTVTLNIHEPGCRRLQPPLVTPPVLPDHATLVQRRPRLR